MNPTDVYRGIRGAARFRFWTRGHARCLLEQLYDRGRNAERGYTDRDHVEAAAGWLARAQDATPDGGVVGRYRLDSGWTSSYPETTGYIVPTFLDLAAHLSDDSYDERARRCMDFLLDLQLESGAFPGGEISRNLTKPSPFNTAQILHGLIVWGERTEDEKALDAARRAGDWLVSVQESDGAWRRYFYHDIASTYSTHLSCWIAQLGAVTGEARYLDCARRHLQWTMEQRSADTGWFDLAGFRADDHERRQAHTHGIAYTLWGILYIAEILGDGDALEAVTRASRAVARRLELSRGLPGMLDWRWRGAGAYECLTGNVQMALIWFRLYRLTGDPSWISPALKAIDSAKRAQSMDNPNPGIRGGIAGSDPIWGGYNTGAFPNWAAKFFVDALIEKGRVLEELPEAELRSVEVPRDPPSPPKVDAGAANRSDFKVVLLTRSGSKKAALMLDTWAAWDFAPAAVVIERKRRPTVTQRLGRVLGERGLSGLVELVLGTLAPSRNGRGSNGTSGPDGRSYCHSKGIATIEVDSLEDEETLRRLRALDADLFVHAGAGILRAPLLEIPRLGTLNAHMGIIPGFRGMNVAEWAALTGSPIGCSVHLIDTGIDTGAIVCVRRVPEAHDATTIAELRAAVDDAQLTLLGDVVRYAVRHGELPPTHEQTLAPSPQYFRMHPEVASILAAKLSGAR